MLAFLGATAAAPGSAAPEPLHAARAVTTATAAMIVAIRLDVRENFI
jgi:hypothetical protein